MLDILLDLNNIQPLALHTSSYETSPMWGTTSIITYSPVHKWVCIFCHNQQGAEVDSYGNPKSHQGDFPHDAFCVWKRAHDFIEETEHTERIGD